MKNRKPVMSDRRKSTNPFQIQLAEAAIITKHQTKSQQGRFLLIPLNKHLQFSNIFLYVNTPTQKLFLS